MRPVPKGPGTDYPELSNLGRVAARSLRLWARGLSEAAWAETPHRQQRFAVHRATTSVMLLWTEHGAWPQLETLKGPRLDEATPHLEPVLADLRDRAGDGRPLNLILASLAPGHGIPPHVDSAPFFGHTRRFHVPLETTPDVRFQVGTTQAALEAAHLYEIDNRRCHEVFNGGPEPRVHLIVDWAQG